MSRLGPRELDKLALHQAGTLAQQRLARGVRLNVPEAASLLASQCLELIRDGKSVAELMDLGRTLLGRRQVCLFAPQTRSPPPCVCRIHADFMPISCRFHAEFMCHRPSAGLCMTATLKEAHAAVGRTPSIGLAV